MLVGVSEYQGFMISVIECFDILYAVIVFAISYFMIIITKPTVTGLFLNNLSDKY